LYSDLQQNVQSILKQDSSHCNAACFILAEARGVIGKVKERYAAMPPPISEGMLIRSVSGPKVAVFTGGGRRWIPDPATLQCMGFNFGQVVVIPDAQWNAIPEGSNFPALTGANCAPAAGSSTANPLDAVSSLTDQLAASFNVPTWAVWGVGGLLAAKIVGVI
jgi:hypothetical protein